MDLYSYTQQLIKTYPLISEQIDKKRLAIVLGNLAKVLADATPGAVVEFGCFVGTTSLFIRRLLNQAERGDFHVYDSFAGLPPKSIQDASMAGSDFKSGELKASKKELTRNFKKAQLKPPVIHKAWFSELKDSDVPEQIGFAFLDGDFYYSIKTSLELVWPRLTSGGVLVIDDYERSSLPGVSRAVVDFFKDKDVDLRQELAMAIVQKKNLD